MFAPHVTEACQHGFEFQRLHSLPRSTSRIHLTDGRLSKLARTSAIAFEESQPSFVYSGNLTALEPANGSLPSDYCWYLSSCRLTDVVEIIPCREERKDSPIIGILLRYSDNRRACLGQYRLDWTTRPLQVNSENLKVGFHIAGNGAQQVMEVVVNSALIQGSYAWKEIPWSGKLDWWFLKNACVLRHPEMKALEM